jgi:adenylate cyclase
MFVQEQPQARLDVATITNETSVLGTRQVTARESHRAMKKQDVTILSVDIRGFTGLAERIDPEQCVDLLNEYFAVAVEVVFEFGGEVDKFQGDGFMAIFADMGQGDRHERRGVKCALHLRNMACRLNLPQLIGERIPLGMGINTGVAAIGKVGSKIRSDYTVIGDVVNVAHYLQRISGPDQIIISGNTQRCMGDDLECAPLGYVRVKRRVGRVEAFLIDSNPGHGRCRVRF